MKQLIRFITVSFFAFCLFIRTIYANEFSDECALNSVKNSDGATSVQEIRNECILQNQEADVERELVKNQEISIGSISSRIINERKTQFNSFVITPHKLNYFLPALTTNAINRKEYGVVNGFEESLEDIEAKFQLSLKVPLNYDSLVFEGDGLYLGFTIEAWWQIYSQDISKPFRETNYQPELFYLAPIDWHPFNGNTGFIVGLEHQSNGREESLSRSWNRLYFQFLFEKEDLAVSIKPWLRINETKKRYPGDPSGDDNPDISDYMGHFELSAIYKWHNLEMSFKGRNNFATHKGAAELSLVFPLWGKLQGYTSIFTGYGESLIDYNYNQTRFGIGLSLNSFL